ncbi:translocation/assembly module TamB domain-containing protein [uncultured Porticoccus sp.]|uniref:translocation/assembly module TamB domain-containing protein n=1 Tax=uncultured Porticoccus sp. TaxID=1256050 RepID=UPI00260E6550|nr:translocation/assembly module TamB domain-containing protein [uncultured Porticoccus sp.]
MKRRLIYRGALLLSALLVVIVGTLLATGYLLIATRTGSHWLLEKAAASATDTEIHWQASHGTLLKGLTFQGLSIRRADLLISATSAAGQWQLLGLLGGQLPIQTLEFTDLQIHVEPTTADSASTFVWPSLNTVMPVTLERLTIDQFQYHSGPDSLTLEEISAAGSVNLLGIDVRELIIRQPEQQLALQGTIRAKPPYRLNIALQWHTEFQQNRFEGEARLGGNLATVTIEHQLSAPFSLTTRGTLVSGADWDRGTLNPLAISVELINDWTIDNRIVWPDLPAISSQGQLRLTGSVDDYQLQGAFELTPQTPSTLPTQQVAVDLRGDRQGLHLENLNLHSAAGKLGIQGDVDWDTTPHWQLAVNLAEIDPGYLLNQKLSGELAGMLTTTGSYRDQGLSVDAKIDQLTGSLNRYPVTLRGQLASRQGVFSSRGFTARIGDNRLRVNGEWGGQTPLNWQLTANNLAELYPGLSGKLVSAGKVSNPGSPLSPRHLPEIQGTVSADELAFDGYSVRSLNLRLNIDKAGLQHIDLALSGSLAGDQQQETDLQLQASGRPEKHHYQLSASQPELTVTLQGTGHWQQGEWQTRISDSKIGTPLVGNWQLDNGVEGRVSEYGAELKEHCWKQLDGVVCGHLTWRKNTGIDTTATLHHLPLQWLQPWLPGNSALSGEINGDLKLAGWDETLVGQLTLSAAAARFTVDDRAKKLRQVTLDNTDLDIRLAEQRLELTGNTKFTDTGNARIQLHWPLAEADRAIGGSLHLQLDKLDWLNPFVTSVDELQGRADALIRLAGTADHPALSGHVQLNGLSAYVPQLGINLTNGDLRLEHRDRTRWQLDGKVDSGEGSLAVNGLLQVNRPDDWRGELFLTGVGVKTVDLETIKASLSPTLKIVATPEQLHITGKIQVPEAEIALKEIPASAVTVSADALIIDQTHPDEEKPSPLNLLADIALELGDDIQFSGFGIHGQVTGNLRLTETPTQPVRAEGILQIVDGVYRTYGQALTIDSGRLVFQGPPDNPLIHARASRTVGDTLVGIQIDGVPGALTSELFSSPSLPQTDILAMLITGKSLAGTTQTEGSTLINAAASLGFSQSDALTGQLQRQLGLDVLSVSSDGGIEESVVTFGKYLTPRLYASYIQNILSPNAGLLLEYSVSKKFKIRAESGATQSMDILWRIERP